MSSRVYCILLCNAGYSVRRLCVVKCCNHLLAVNMAPVACMRLWCVCGWKNGKGRQSVKVLFGYFFTYSLKCFLVTCFYYNRLLLYFHVSSYMHYSQRSCGVLIGIVIGILKESANNFKAMRARL